MDRDYQIWVLDLITITNKKVQKMSVKHITRPKKAQDAGKEPQLKPEGKED